MESLLQNTASLPSTTTALIAFITAANVVIVVTFIRYIQKKNGHLERVAANFAQQMADARTQFDQMLEAANDRHANTMREQRAECASMLRDAQERLERCVMERVHA